MRGVRQCLLRCMGIVRLMQLSRKAEWCQKQGGEGRKWHLHQSSGSKWTWKERRSIVCGLWGTLFVLWLGCCLWVCWVYPSLEAGVGDCHVSFWCECVCTAAIPVQPCKCCWHPYSIKCFGGAMSRIDPEWCRSKRFSQICLFWACKRWRNSAASTVRSCFLLCNGRRGVCKCGISISRKKRSKTQHYNHKKKRIINNHGWN